jgi:hypothetical protein
MRLVTVMLLVHASHARAPDRFTFVEVPDPLSGINPTYPLVPMIETAVGDTFLDPEFGTTQVRATATDGIHGRHEYARFDPFNCDKTMILLDPDELWSVYGTSVFPYNQPSNLVQAVHIEEIRWDPPDPNTLWSVSGFEIRTVNVVTGATAAIKDFSRDPTIGPLIPGSPVYRITMKDEGESSRDERFWAFFLQGNDQADCEPLFVFTWDRQTDTVLGVYPIPPNERALDWAGMSVLGNRVVIGGDGQAGDINGLTIATPSFTFSRDSGPIGHCDVGLDTEGREVVAGQNAGTDYVDMIICDATTPPLPVMRLFYSSDSPSGLQSGIHVSCNAEGYAMISTHIEPGLPERNWLDRSNVLVRLDPLRPRVFYLSKVHNTTQTYWEETHGTISSDGPVVVWADNWGQNVGRDQVALTTLMMPSDWREMTGGAGGAPQPPLMSGVGVGQSFPNPFSDCVVIPYRLAQPDRVERAVYDLLGHRLQTLVSRRLCAGSSHQALWDGRDERALNVASGLCLCHLRTA